MSVLIKSEPRQVPARKIPVFRHQHLFFPVFVNIDKMDAQGKIDLFQIFMFANVCPRLCVDLYEKSVGGQKDEAIALQIKLNRLLADLVAANFSGGWGIVKMSLSIRGICDKTVTHPMPTCTEEERPVLEKIMKKYDLL